MLYTLKGMQHISAPSFLFSVSPVLSWMRTADTVSIPRSLVAGLLLLFPYIHRQSSWFSPPGSLLSPFSLLM